MTVTADNHDEAVDKLMEEAKMHLAQAHPEMQKTDEEIRNDVASHMKMAEDGMSSSDML